MFECPRHGPVEVLFSDHFASEPGILTMGCGCRGTLEQLRDPEFLKAVEAVPEDPAAEILSLEARLADVKARLAAQEPPAATPAAVAHAEATGVDLAEVEGTGKDGTITKPDVVAHIEGEAE